MHGRLCEQTHRRLHMWPVPVPTTVAVDPSPFSLDSFSKDGRKIHTGDCALFKPPRDSPPFIGIIRRLTKTKEEGLKLGVSWLYRPADVKLGKGNFVEAAPNEIFYSFHKDEIPAASLLHPCKVTFLRKGVELPFGVSSFVCRRVYDIENKRLWWLTDQDYINSFSAIQEWQEEVDSLLDKTRQEMHGVTQLGGRSSKPLNGPTSSPQLKPTSDIVQHTNSPVHSQVRGKRRERSDQGSDIVKRDRLCKTDDGDFGHFRPEHVLKSELAKITEKGGLINIEGVEKLLQLMQPDSSEKRLDLACRIILADAISVTEKPDCLRRFLQLSGLRVLDEWLQDVHKGKIGDGSSSKESDKSVEEFLLALLCALDRLPVNLDALQTCNAGKSVNHLRSHKNSEIQRKARSIVDTWKKRVEAEMILIDAKSGSNQSVSWPSKPVLSEICHAGSRRIGGASEAGLRSSGMQPSTPKAVQVKAGSGEAACKFSPVTSPCPTKTHALSTTSASSYSKDLNPKINFPCGTFDQPWVTIKEERSSTSGQSQNNSQSSSSDRTRTVGSSCREDARSSSAVSGNTNKISSSNSRHQKTGNGLSNAAAPAVQKETGIGKFSSSNKSLTSERILPAGLSDGSLDHGNNQRLIVRLPNAGHSPARSASGGSFDDPAVTVFRSSPAGTEKTDNSDQRCKGKNDVSQSSIASAFKMASCQIKDELIGSDVANGPAFAERSQAGADCEKPIEGLIAGLPGTLPKSGGSCDASFSSINALLESCVKISEPTASAFAGDQVGMNLLASVAAGEISKSEIVSSFGSSLHSPSMDSGSSGDAKLKQLDENIDQSQSQPENVANCIVSTVQGYTVDALLANIEPEQCSTPILDNFSREEKIEEPGSQLNSSGVALQPNDGPYLTSDEKFQDHTRDVDREDEGNNHLYEQKKDIAGSVIGEFNSNQVVRSSLSNDDQKADCADEKSVAKVDAVASEAAGSHAKIGREADEDSASERDGNDKKTPHADPTSGTLFDRKPEPLVNVFPNTESKCEATSFSCEDIVGIDLKDEKDDELKAANHVGENDKFEMDSGKSGQSSRCCEENLERREASGNCQQGIQNDMESNGGNLLANEAGGLKEHSSCANSSALGSDMAVKLDFDLNEGFPGDDGNQGELKSQVPGNQSVVYFPCPSPFPMSSTPGSLASVTFAAAAKGPFLPPENPLRNKGELGWKGSAATSAFRPAEPRRVLEVPLTSTNVPLSDASSGKHGGRHLDFDLNVPDHRALEDLPPQNSVRLASFESERKMHSKGGLDFDLNRADENPDRVPPSMARNACATEMNFTGRSPLSIGMSSEENASTAPRGFDLNNGPGLDETGIEMALHGHNVKSHNMPFPSPVSVAGVCRPELGSFSSWFPAVTSYSAITIPPALAGRVEQIYPAVAVATSGSQRGVIGHLPSGPEIYGPVLSSSPAMGFPSAAPFQYHHPGFPFETSFPLPSHSFSGSSSAYMDASSGGALCFPAIPSQFMGPAGLVPSHYPRPFAMSIPGATSCVGPESRKWGSQSLDLNAGPGTADIERKDERVLSGLRQLPVPSSPAMADEQLKMHQGPGGVLKRKEPDGGWDGSRGGCYKQQASWK